MVAGVREAVRGEEDSPPWQMSCQGHGEASGKWNRQEPWALWRWEWALEPSASTPPQLAKKGVWLGVILCLQPSRGDPCGFPSSHLELPGNGEAKPELSQSSRSSTVSNICSDDCARWSRMGCETYDSCHHDQGRSEKGSIRHCDLGWA